ncbi:MAG: formate dehydrogenase accessory protein FdhE [Rubrivivax sp. SCN 71-131]|nr:MAG: formate dehydrogenase accessory protein FdhE [Rubrivivax sp. SCN 71-131]
MSAEAIAAAAGEGDGGLGAPPALIWPERGSVFAERQMRLRQLAPGHAMDDFLLFMAELAQVQHAALQAYAEVPLPDAAALERAQQAGLPPLPAADWPRDAAWRVSLRSMVQALRRVDMPEGMRAALDAAGRLSDDALERQADCLLTGVMHGVDLATAPLVAAALQVHWTQLALGLHARGWRPRPGAASAAPAGRPLAPADAGSCPCCGSRPTASLTRSTGRASGQRVLQCSLCSVQWPLPRIQCAHCMATEPVYYQSLELAQAGADESAGRAAQAVVQAECCSDCGHYLKIMHRDRDAFVDAVADDLATLTLDLLVSEAGMQRHGVNLMLLFGEPEPASQASREGR